MTPTLWVSIILGIGGTLGAIFTGVSKLLDWKSNKLKKTGEIKLDKASYDEIASRAAKINSDERIETERWWKEQFDAVKIELKETREELASEKAWRRKTTKRLREHQPWDDMMHGLHPELGVPPLLLNEDEEDETEVVT